MKQETRKATAGEVAEELRTVAKEYFVGVTQQTEGGFVLELGTSGKFNITVTRIDG